MGIVYSHDSSSTISSFAYHHRNAIWNCPFCDYKVESVKEWILPGRVKEVIFGDYFHIKKDEFIAVSECPKCFELSWEHFPLRDFEETAWNKPNTDIDITKVRWEIERRTEATRKEFSACICKHCRKLDTLKLDRYTAFRTCKKGMGPVEQECKDFEEETK